MVLKIAVIGAGIIGLSSAVAVQNRLQDASVTIIADRLTRHTTSHGSGGLFVPEAEGIPEALGNRWGKDGAEHFFDLATSSESASSGVSLVSGLELHNGEKLPPWANFMINLQDIPQELKPYFLKYYKYGHMFTTAIIEGNKYLPWLTNRYITPYTVSLCT
ncbi:D-aspartate oxidase-like [Plakobranchus ocellatus]|uniref:D-aspartate oxidase-like n=1 Tax=Plakobranchus ocellatus TaxID=259542 RepID=A0AAV3Z8I9_9GAST|nr:D-aspartate oxidase-like [Plakobranchus ocellatus]